MTTSHPNHTIPTHLINPVTMAFLKASCMPTLIFVLLLCNLRASDAQTPPLAEGLSYTFHQSSCPQLESIVRSQLQTELAADIGQAAGLLRLHFHDCFVLVSLLN